MLKTLIIILLFLIILGLIQFSRNKRKELRSRRREIIERLKSQDH